MSKESSSTRIPRLDGVVTRIPLPGSFRPPASSASASSGGGASLLGGGRPSQILRPPSVSYGQQRPVSLTGLRPPSALDSTQLLKRSSSGDRISNAVSLVGKKTTAAFQKFIGSSTSRLEKVKPFVRKPIGAAPKEDTNQTVTEQEANRTQTIVGTPRPQLTRSETFVRGDSQLDMLGVTRDVTMQPETPALRKPMISSTPQIGFHNAGDCTQLFSDTITVDRRQETHLLESRRSAFGKTMDISNVKDMNNTKDLTKFGTTMQVVGPDTTQQLFSATVNLTKTFEAVLGQTMDMAPPPLGSTMAFVNTFTNETRIKDAAEDDERAATPATNATYSNPGSMENLQMLDDVSVPSEFNTDDTLKPVEADKDLMELSPLRDDTLIAGMTPNKAAMNLPLNSTMNTERLLDISATSLLNSPRHMQLLNLTKDFATPKGKNTTQLLYMTQVSSSATTTPDGLAKFQKGTLQHTPMPYVTQMTPMLMKGARSDLVLPTRTPTDEACHGRGEPMDVDSTVTGIGARTEQFLSHHAGVGVSLQDMNNPNQKQKSRFSFGLDLTESTLDCSIELVDVSLSSTGQSQRNNSVSNRSGGSVAQSPTSAQLQQQLLKKQNSFDFDESLGILTPDQMKEFLDSNTTNTNNLDLPLGLNANCSGSHKLSFHQMRIDQTPSPEELPLDPVEVKTDISDMVLAHPMQQQHQQQQQQHQLYHSQLQPSSGDLKQPLQSNCTSMVETISTHTDTDVSKADTMTKSSVSKISTSFITSVTSVTSLDTGYQGDGEMSRPASRGAGDHSPSNGPMVRKGCHVSRQPSFNQPNYNPMPQPPVRRPDPMTDSDFFTESDADDVFHRGDRRAQVIDGQLYGPMLQPTASVFISEDPQMEDSCMESSGIFTDVENRCDEDLAQMRRRDDAPESVDMSPDGDDSTETVKSNRKNGNEAAANQQHHRNSQHSQQTAKQCHQNHLHSPHSHRDSNSQSLSSLLHSCSADRVSGGDTTSLSNRTSYCSVDGVMNATYKSFSSLDEACWGETGTGEGGESVTSSTTRRSPPSHAACYGVDGVANATYKSFSSLEEGSCGESGIGEGGESQRSPPNHTPYRSAAQPNHNSARKHTSLTSLCCEPQKPVGKVNNHNNNNKNINNNSNTIATPQNPSAKKSNASVKAASVISPKYRSPKLSTPSPKNPAQSHSPSAGHVARKSHSPNKWDAVMNKIANNKVNAIKKNYNEVKSKVFSSSSRSSVASAASGATGSGGPMTPRSATSSPSTTTSVSLSLRRSPSATVKISVKSPTPSPAAASKTRVTAAAAASPTSAALQRGRSYSKDSQKSSQSDLSLSSAAGTASVASGVASGGNASPKLTAKTPLRAAKKRDVRNLSISPTDLGPPPKTQQTAKGASSRPKPVTVTLTQKRLVPSPSQAPSSANSSQCSGSLKNSPVAKKHTILTRRFDVLGKSAASSAKATVKDHNRVVDSSQQQHLSITKVNGKPDASAAAANVAVDAEDAVNGDATVAGISIANNNNSNNSLNKNNTRNNLSPLLGSNAVARNVAATRRTPTEAVAAAGVPEKKKVQTTRKLLFQRNTTPPQPQPAHATGPQNAAKLRPQHSMEVSTPISGPQTNAPEYLDPMELRQLKMLNRHSCNGRLDYAALERHLQRAELVEQHQSKGVEALGVLLQYLVYEMDAFACPMAKSEAAKAKDSLSKTLHLLEEAKSTCTELQDQLCDKEAYFNQREEELQALHRCELDKVKTESQSLAKQQIAAVEAKFAAKEADQQRTVDSYRLEMEGKFAQKLEQIQLAEERERELKERLQASESRWEALSQQLAETQTTYTARLQEAEERENSLSERLKLLSRELDDLKSSKESREQELRDKLLLSQDELSVLRTTRRSLNECGATAERQQMSPRRSTNSAMSHEIERLQNETESLRCVLEMKQTEIFKLSRQNEELRRDAEDRLVMQSKLSNLEAQKELLEDELKIKANREKELTRQIEEINKAYTHESTKRTRLSYDNEALQYQLKNRSEQLQIVEAKLQELSGSDSALLNGSHNTSLSFKSSANTFSGSLDTTDGGLALNSPPSSPIVKAVIKKPESMSWVLEMDEETPEAAACKMVKRAGSFRAPGLERSPSTRRQLSMSASAACSGSSPAATCPNPLSQSMSATSVIRQHSTNDVSMECAPRSTLARTRSKSMSVKGSEATSPGAKSAKKASRQSSTGQSRKKDLVAATWKEPISASSPYNAMRPRTSTMNRDSEETLIFRRPSAGCGSSSSGVTAARKLITCDTSTLNSGEKLEMRSLPTHPSVHDLKVLKKYQEIQESAGEAMLSGTNSEDEGCSASSDEIISSTASTTSGTGTGSTSSLNQLKNNHMSLEEVLQIEKINSLNGTPMEMSWSDDADGAFVNTSSTV